MNITLLTYTQSLLFNTMYFDVDFVFIKNYKIYEMVKMYNVQCTLYIVHFTMYHIHCSLYITIHEKYKVYSQQIPIEE